jgi:hypothetical protein
MSRFITCLFLLSISNPLFAQGADGTAGGFISMMPKSSITHSSRAGNADTYATQPVSSGGFIQMMPHPRGNGILSSSTQGQAPITAGNGFIQLMRASNGASAPPSIY